MTQTDEHAKAIRGIWKDLEAICNQTPIDRPYIDTIERVMNELDELHGEVSSFDLSEHLTAQKEAAMEFAADARAGR